MKLKMIVITLVMLVSLSGLSAQKTKKSKDDVLKMRLEKLDSIVKLSSDQKTKVYDLMSRMFDQRKEIADKYEKGSAEFKGAMEDLRCEKRKGIKLILTEEQLKLLKAHAQKRKAERNNKRGDGLQK